MNKYILFSDYIDENNISSEPIKIYNKTQHRYSITIPFKDRDNKSGISVIVIMKNPSTAGKFVKVNGIKRRQSDDTIYRVLDYLYKQKEYNIKEVVIVNLMSIYSGTLSNIIKEAKSIEILSKQANLTEIEKKISSSKPQDIIIVAWGGFPGYPKIEDDMSYNISSSDLKKYYNKLIDSTHKILKDKKVYRVGTLTEDGFPRHGKYWYDYEELFEYEF